jgi:hypothetical protein
MGDVRVLEEVEHGPRGDNQVAEGRLRNDAFGGERRTAAAGDRSGGGNLQENPYIFTQAAQEQFLAGNNKTAEEQWKKAIEAADKLPHDQYRAKLAEVESQLKTESDPLKSQEMLRLRDGLHEVVNLPTTLRVETALFYLQNAKPDEAREMLAQALKRDPSLKDNERFRQLSQIAQENSSGTLEKAANFLKSTGKELLSDGISGGAGLVAFSLTPGGRLLKLGSALLAGGATKHGLAVAGLGGDANSPLKNFAWGGVDALAMVSGAAVRDRMMGTFERSITSVGARDIAVKGGITQAEKLAVFEGKLVPNALAGYRDSALVMTEGKSGLDALKSATAMVTENVAAKRAAYRTELEKAVAAAPWHEKPLLWVQGNYPLLWKLPNERLSAFQAAKREYLAARGSSLEYLNPLNMFRSPAEYNGTLKGLQATTFWSRYKIDAASVGAASLVYRGAHEGVKVGDTDPATGKEYSAYDAITNTVKGTAADAINGGFLVGAFRYVGGAFSPKLEWASKALSARGIDAGRWLSPGLRNGLAAVPTAGALFSPEIHEAYGTWEKSSEYEKILSEIRKPLEDKNPPVPEKKRSDVPE